MFGAPGGVPDVNNAISVNCFESNLARPKNRSEVELQAAIDDHNNAVAVDGQKMKARAALISPAPPPNDSTIVASSLPCFETRAASPRSRANCPPVAQTTPNGMNRFYRVHS